MVLQMKGEHKLWKLPSEKLVHYQRSLRTVRWPVKRVGGPQQEETTAATTALTRATPSQLQPDGRAAFEFAVAVLEGAAIDGESWKQFNKAVPRLLSPDLIHIQTVFPPMFQIALQTYLRDRIAKASRWHHVETTATSSSIWASAAPLDDEVAVLHYVKSAALEVTRHSPIWRRHR